MESIADLFGTESCAAGAPRNQKLGADPGCHSDAVTRTGESCWLQELLNGGIGGGKNPCNEIPAMKSL